MIMQGPWTYMEEIYSKIAFLQAKTSFSKATTPESTCTAWKLNGEVIGWFVDQTWRWNAWDTNVFTCRTFVWMMKDFIYFFHFSNVNGTTHFPTLPIISSPTCLQDLRPSPCDANDLQWQRHQQHLAYLKSLGSSKLSRCLTKGDDFAWLHCYDLRFVMCKMHPHLLIFRSSRLSAVVSEVKPTAWQWKTQKEGFHRCQRPKRLRHISLRLKSESTPLLRVANRLEYSYWRFKDGSHGLSPKYSEGFPIEMKVGCCFLLVA